MGRSVPNVAQHFSPSNSRLREAATPQAPFDGGSVSLGFAASLSNSCTARNEPLVRDRPSSHSRELLSESRGQPLLKAVHELLRWGLERLGGMERLEVEVLLSDCLGCDRSMLALQLEKEVSADRVERFVEWINRRAQGEPMAYIRGKKEFWSLDFYVDRRVLIPRPETELLVEQALSSMIKSESGEVADIGTGSGAIGIALAKERRGWNFVATDSSQEALEVAAENAKRHEVADRIEFREGDLCVPLQDRKGEFDLIVANLPYIPRSDLENLSVDVKNYEPLRALDGGEDGLEFIFRLVQEARSCLRPQGWLLLEIGLGEASAVMDRMRQLGFREIHSREDLQGIPRIVWGQIVWGQVV